MFPFTVLTALSCPVYVTILTENIYEPTFVSHISIFDALLMSRVKTQTEYLI